MAKNIYNDFKMIFWGEEKNEGKRRQKNGQTLIISKTAFFGHILKKSAQSFFGAWSFLLIHIQFTPGEVPKDFVVILFYCLYFSFVNRKKNHTMNVGP